MDHPITVQYTPTVKHFHNQVEMQCGVSSSSKSRRHLGLILKWYSILWILSLAPFGNSIKETSCTFPARWTGKWFQSGVIQPILIEGDTLSNKGKCISSEGDKFLIVDEKGCYRCVVMHEKHINVLQYKETFCHRKDVLPHLCSLITGDALLYSMFRENAAPVSCPLKGPFSFTYNRGHGDCKFPASSIESCTEDSRLLLNYQACPDVYGSESTVEELECLATWKEGSLRFLVGKVHHNHATSNEDRYRCFVYEKTNGIASSLPKENEDGIEYRVAQSGDATCNGLFSATEGSRTMALKRVPLSFKCRFPSWMTFSAHWHTLDFTGNYSFHQKNATLKISNQTGGEEKVHCVSVKATSQTGKSVALVTHWQHHCMSRYVCVAVYRRDTWIAEIQRGEPSLKPDDACTPQYFDAVTAPYVTLVANHPETKECPFSGNYAISGLKYQNIRSVRSLVRGRRGKEINEHYPKEYPTRHLQKIKQNRTISNLRDLSFLSNDRLLRSKRSISEEESKCNVNNFKYLDIGCATSNIMEFHSPCGEKDFVTGFSCHGGWYEDGTSYVIATPLTRDSIAARRYCFMWREEHAERDLRLASSDTNCDRAWTQLRHSLTFNASLTGDCEDTSNARSRLLFNDQLLVFMLLLVFVSNFVSR